MGFACPVSLNTAQDSQLNPLLDLGDLPSPASDVSLDSPALGQASLNSRVASTTFEDFPAITPGWPDRFSSAAFSHQAGPAAAAIAPEPEAVPAASSKAVMTPDAEKQCEPGARSSDLDMLTRQTHRSLPLRDGPNLRLPPFAQFGLPAPLPDSSPSTAAAPHSTHAGVVTASDYNNDLYSNVQDVRDSSSGLGAGYADTSAFTGLRPDFTLRHPLGHLAALTPPAETGEPQWGSFKILSAANAMQSPDGTNSSRNLSLSSDHPVHADQAESGNVTPSAIPAADADESNESTTSPPDPKSGIVGAIDVLRRNIRSLSMPLGSLRVLSHALPCPSANGFAYPEVIGSIHDSTPSSPTVWINVFHAVPGRFNLADLPTSPPATPGPAVGGEDYFTQKVFDSAVPVADYVDDLRSIPRSPRPVVPPSSINICAVERYIPPSSAIEFAEMFNVGSPSILLDRLVELSPHNGTMIFVYPTKVGAGTFLREYLSPILDPILRSMVVMNGLSSDLSAKLGRMPAVDLLLDHRAMALEMSQLCARLSQPISSEIFRMTDGKRANFRLAYTSTLEVFLERDVWAKCWWTKQEKTRVRELLTKYVQEANSRSSADLSSHGGGLSAIALMQQLLDGVCKRPYPVGQEPKHGVEVSVFVVTRTE